MKQLFLMVIISILVCGCVVTPYNVPYEPPVNATVVSPVVVAPPIYYGPYHYHYWR